MGDQFWGPLLTIHRPGKRSFGKFLTSREKWGADSSCWKYIRPLLFKSRGNSSSRNRSYASSVGRPSKKKGPVSWSSRTSHHTLSMKSIWKLFSTMARGLSFDHTWELGVCFRHRRDWGTLRQLTGCNDAPTIVIKPAAKFWPLSQTAMLEM